MAGKGAPVGNRYSAKGKEWFDALRKECVQKDALRQIAELVVLKAMMGEQWAIAEITTRFDGKPAQAVEVSGLDGGPIEVADVTAANVDERIAELTARLQAGGG